MAPPPPAAAFHDGWYVTGDIGLVDEDGFLKLTGRVARFSKIGGEMVPHERVEEALHRAIAASDRVFAVTAVDDDHKGEQLAVLYTTARLRRRPPLRNRRASLADPVHPRGDRLIKVDALPTLGTGKLDLREVRRIAEGALAVANAE